MHNANLANQQQELIGLVLHDFAHDFAPIAVSGRNPGVYLWRRTTRRIFHIVNLCNVCRSFNFMHATLFDDCKSFHMATFATSGRLSQFAHLQRGQRWGLTWRLTCPTLVHVLSAIWAHVMTHVWEHVQDAMWTHWGSYVEHTIWSHGGLVSSVAFGVNVSWSDCCFHKCNRWCCQSHNDISRAELDIGVLSMILSRAELDFGVWLLSMTLSRAELDFGGMLINDLSRAELDFGVLTPVNDTKSSGARLWRTTSSQSCKSSGARLWRKSRIGNFWECSFLKISPQNPFRPKIAISVILPKWGIWKSVAQNPFSSKSRFLWFSPKMVSESGDS
jgi:hypothetical protein